MEQKYKHYTITLTLADGSTHRIPISIPVGKNGEKGDPGYTPKKGIDFFTASDKAEMVSHVIAALPKYKGEVASV